jgi:hypothetical protein
MERWKKQPYNCSVKLTLYFHLKNPLTNWDIDNHLKAVKDAMKGIVFADDYLVCNYGDTDKRKTVGIEGFEFNVVPCEIQIAVPHFEPYKRIEPAEKRLVKSTMTAEEFNRRYGITKPKTF